MLKARHCPREENEFPAVRPPARATAHPRARLALKDIRHRKTPWPAGWLTVRSRPENDIELFRIEVLGRICRRALIERVRDGPRGPRSRFARQEKMPWSASKDKT